MLPTPSMIQDKKPPSFNEVEAIIANALPRAECPVKHSFFPGMYVREIFIPAGTLGTSMRHRTEHPFTILKGRIQVMSENEGAVIYQAPHTGRTLPGTKRMLLALEDTVWITYHATTETDVDKIGKEILDPHENDLIPEELKNQWALESPQHKLS